MLEEDICENAAAEIDKAETYTKGIFKMYGGEVEEGLPRFEKSLVEPVFDKFGETAPITQVDENTCTAIVHILLSNSFKTMAKEVENKIV